MTNINFLLTISIQCQEIRLWELIKSSPKRKFFDLLSNSLNSSFKEKYRDQYFGEFVCGYWGLKGWLTSLTTDWIPNQQVKTGYTVSFPDIVNLSTTLIVIPFSLGNSLCQKNVLKNRIQFWVNALNHNVYN